MSHKLKFKKIKNGIRKEGESLTKTTGFGQVRDIKDISLKDTLKSIEQIKKEKRQF